MPLPTAMHPSIRLILVFAIALLALGSPASAQSTWDGSDSALWSGAGNWDVAPTAGAALVFTAAAPGNLTMSNDLDLNANGTSTFSGLTFNTNVNGPLSISGNAIQLSGNLTNLNNTAGRNVTIGTDVEITAGQTWNASVNNSITMVSGNLTGSGVTITGNTNDSRSALPNLRLTGTNSGFTGNLSLTGSNTSGVYLGSAASMIGGVININSTDQTVWFQGGGSAGTYTAGIGNAAPGSGNGSINFRNNGSGGLRVVGGNVNWTPGGGNYTLLNGTLNGGQIRIGQQLAAEAATPRVIHFGNSNQTLTVGNGTGSAPAALAVTNASGNTIFNLRYALNGSAGGGNVALGVPLTILNTAATGNLVGTTTLTSGATALASMDRIFDGNLNLNGGVLVLDGVSWSSFVADRSGNYGTGANQWQLTSTSGGFAARGSSLTIDSTGTTSTTFDTSFTIGSSARGADGNLYANAGVILDRGAGTDTIALSASNNRTIQVAGRLVISGGVYGDLSTSPINEISGNIVGGAAARVLTIQAANNGNVASGTNGGILRISGNNTFQGTLKIGSDDPGSTNGYGVLIATSDAAFGDAANVVQVASSTPGPDSGWALLLEDTNGAGSTTFSRDFLFANRGGGTQNRPWALGSYAGDVIYDGTVSIQDVAGITTGNGTYGVGLHAQAGSTLTLGTNGGNDAVIQTSYISGNAHVMQLEKTGSGTLILGNLSLTPNGSNSFTLNIGRGGIDNTLANPFFDGAVRETGNGTTNSFSGRLITLAGGVLESSDSVIGSSFTRSLGSGVTNVRWQQGGGGFAAFGGALTVNIGGAGAGLEWSATNFVGDNNPLIFGSETADNKVTFANVIGLDNSDNSTVDREIRVIDNPDSAGDVAEISGNIANRGNLAGGGSGNRSITKTGNGTLILSGGNNSYNGNTTVSAGTLLVNGVLDTRTSVVSVAAGATLGGNGTINRAVTVSGTLAPGNSPGLLNTGNLSLTHNSTFALELNGTTPGNGSGNHDQVAVTGSITLGGGASDRVNLTLSLGYPVAVNDVFIVMLNDGADAVNYGGGSFGLFRYNGGDLTNNSTFGVGAYTFQIDYAYSGAGADGNDVALIVTAIPEPGAGILILGGFGLLALFRRRSV